MNLRNFGEKKQNEQDTVKEAGKKYGSYSQDELMTELLMRVSKSKQDGSFDREKLEQFAAAVSPSLTKEQRRRLTELIQSL